MISMSLPFQIHSSNKETFRNQPLLDIVWGYIENFIYTKILNIEGQIIGSMGKKTDISFKSCLDPDL